MEPENKPFFRFPATKVSVLDLEEGEYIEEKEQNPNYLLIRENQKIFRINIIATLVHKEMKGSISSMLVDDGTGKIVMRLFEENKAALNLEVGDIIEIVGKIRVYNSEKYIFPEIIKKVSPLWLKVRYLELQSSLPALTTGQNNKKETLTSKKTETTKEQIEQKIIKELPQKLTSPSQKVEEVEFKVVSEEIEENDPLLPLEKLSKLIAQLDKGEGVLIEEIIEKSPLEKTEELLEKMLENGDIFQNQPGKVRLL